MNSILSKYNAVFACRGVLAISARLLVAYNVTSALAVPAHAARSVAEPFDDPDWLFEIKYDRFRALACHRPGRNLPTAVSQWQQVRVRCACAWHCRRSALPIPLTRWRNRVRR
jgi:hypothetical protein